MKKYIYTYNIYTNNLTYGYMKIKEFKTLKEAQQYISQNGSLSGFGYNGYINKYGCCDIQKRRKYIKES